MKRVSLKMAAQHRLEAELKKRMIRKANGNFSGMVLCALCGRYNFVVSKHEIKLRSAGGDPLDEANCVLLCLSCHTKEKDPAKRHRSLTEFPYAPKVQEC